MVTRRSAILDREVAIDLCVEPQARRQLLVADEILDAAILKTGIVPTEDELARDAAQSMATARPSSCGSRTTIAPSHEQ
jgi:hypothetical protein